MNAVPASVDDFPAGRFEPVSQVAHLRAPPHSIEAESSLLGGLLLDNSAWERVGDLVAETDFYRAEHRAIFGVISKLLNSKRGADQITVFEVLRDGGRADDAGGLAYLDSLAQYVPSASNMRRFAEIVREKSVLRKLISASDEIATSAFHPQDRTVEAIVDEAQAALAKLTPQAPNDEWVSAYDGMVKHSDILEKRAAGTIQAWPTGLGDLDEYLEGGLVPGNLVIIGARPSQGKTALGLTIGVNMADVRGVGLLSMEMSHSEVNDRLTAMLGNVTMSAVKRPSKGEGLNWGRVVEGVEKAKVLRLYVSDQGGLTINQVRTKARNLKRLHGIDVLVVDYIGLMTGLNPKENRNTQLGEISRGLKTLAKELQICVVCLAQLNRKAEERADQMPQMTDLRDSGEIEQDADVIVFIKRPIMSNPEIGDEWRYYAKASVAKNRQGRCGYLNLTYIGEQTRFASWTGDAPFKSSAPQKRGM
ncbi:MAG: replicative DNA helicase [Ramlibacter sp.]|nr:replicative DNA helicase [Ramlibacter sp.]